MALRTSIKDGWETPSGTISVTIKESINLRSIPAILSRLGVDTSSPDRLATSLPFSVNDTTAGSENELQVAVIGHKQDVDLPLTIEQSDYFANIVRRTAAGDTPRKTVGNLEQFLNNNKENIWENSWVRFPRKHLNTFTANIFLNDLLADKKQPAVGLRSDMSKFLFRKDDEEHVRVPISYLIKLALADAISYPGTDACPTIAPRLIRETGREAMGHFLSDNTSPETHSFYVVPLSRKTGMGRAIAGETAKRYLLTQLLVAYANKAFRLEESGQKAVVFFSPHPPTRQKKLNDCISDAFYRELFMNPCLAGWDKGQAKHDYMHLCHGVLSRSQLNAVAKMKEAGVLPSNLVVLPNMSNISLANNGTHLSLGSRRLTERMASGSNDFTAAHEKCLGDLTIKITEHFLPLFVGLYSAAPYRIDFAGFHPERVLGFLPHELDYTHLRMFWRRWRKKADLCVFGRSLTPFGPPWIDNLISKTFGLGGDYVPDFRLIDYPVALLSTDRSPSLNGIPGNTDKLKKDLADLGVFSDKMSLYLIYKLREFGVMGFSGFEGRHYSLFESLTDDMGHAADLQMLINALAYKYMADGRITHNHIPDNPVTESERRQMLFGAAAGIPTFFVRSNTDNHFLRRILTVANRTRQSHRYPGYTRVYMSEYLKALVTVLREDAADLIDVLGLDETLRNLSDRVASPDEYSAAGKLTRNILAETDAKSPMKLKADDFNLAAEKFYRGALRKNLIAEAFDELESSAKNLVATADDDIRQALNATLGGQELLMFVKQMKERTAEESATETEIRKLIYIMLIEIRTEKQIGKTIPQGETL